MQDVELRAIYLERDGTVIELLHFTSPGSIDDPERPRPLNRHGLTHLSFLVDDLAAVQADVARWGGRTLEETRVTAAAETRVVFCTDPDGTLIELMQRSDR